MLPRRKVLWLIPAALGSGVAALVARRLSWRYDTLPAPPAPQAPGQEVSIVDFSADGKNLGAKLSRKVAHLDSYWLAHLTSQQYYVTRKKATDTPYIGTYHRLHGRGLYRCICCNTALFSSEAKYDSGTGWPSFWTPIAKENIARVDEQGATLETGIEVLCRLCDAHLGHIFGDGPEPTHLRYCINESSLRFVATT
jgi:peptide-methionine (R)-S-oxide reductase